MIQSVQDLLDEIQFPDGEPNPFAIVDSFDKEENLITVSDGSIIFHDMSFGWVLASPNGIVLAQGAVPGNGRGNSLQSKGADMLVFTVFIPLVLAYTNRTNLSLKYISDNQELINVMKDDRDYDFLFPNETTKFEFDITKQIFCTTKSYSISANYIWVRGHQDQYKT